MNLYIGLWVEDNNLCVLSRYAHTKAAGLELLKNVMGVYPGRLLVIGPDDDDDDCRPCVLDDYQVSSDGELS